MQMPSYAMLRRHVAWRDAEGRLYVPAGALASVRTANSNSDSTSGASSSDDDGDGDGDDDGGAPWDYVLLPLGETRRRGAGVGTGEAQLEFPEPGDDVELEAVAVPVPKAAHHATGGVAQAGAAWPGAATAPWTRRVLAVERARQRGAVARVFWEGAPA